MLTPRIEEELRLIRKHYPQVGFVEEGWWFRIPDFGLAPEGHWHPPRVDVVFQAPEGYPGTHPYGIYVPPRITFDGRPPNNYAAASKPIPFPGTWWVLSWYPEAWRPTADVASGPNILSFVWSIQDRFREGV